MQYTLQDAAQICILIEPHLASIGLHAAIGGSLAYRGTSTKDIDIILYPHNRDVVVKRLSIVSLLISIGFTPVKELPPTSTRVPDVHATTSAKGERVDFFFMQRGEFMPTNPIPPCIEI